MAQPSLLLIGGSGFVSGTLARRAVAQGFQVTAVTRGQRAMPEGVTPIVADRRDRAAFARAISEQNQSWDLVIDCIGYEPDDARQDVEVFRERARHLVFISTDFVFDPARRVFPQPEEGHYLTNGSYGAKKRLCEIVFEEADTGSMAWTIIRPCHIYGPGSLLGCLPKHGRDPELIAKLRAGKPLELVGGGHFLQHPILARDLADLCLSVHGQPQVDKQIYLAAGPDYVESRTYFAIVADLLGVPLKIIEVPVDAHLAAHPEAASHLCHRIYDLRKLQASGLRVPSTPLEQGLREHVASMLD